jgi:hypothetical protein
MRRAIAEWGLVVSLVIALTAAGIWVDALSSRALEEPLAVFPGVFMRVTEGTLCLFTELGANWKPQATGNDKKAQSWVRQYTIGIYPGIEYHHRLFASGRTVWSLEISLVIPLVISLILMAIFWRLRRGGSRGRPSVATH